MRYSGAANFVSGRLPLVPAELKPHACCSLTGSFPPPGRNHNLTKYRLEPLYYEFYIPTLPRTPCYVNNATKYCLEPFSYEFYIALLGNSRDTSNLTKCCLELFAYYSREALLGGHRSRNSFTQYCLETLSLLWKLRLSQGASRAGQAGYDTGCGMPVVGVLQASRLQALVFWGGPRTHSAM